nr:hypothetical protein [Tanacetum cinerariifolium]
MNLKYLTRRGKIGNEFRLQQINQSIYQCKCTGKKVSANDAINDEDKVDGEDEVDEEDEIHEVDEDYESDEDALPH